MLRIKLTPKVRQEKSNSLGVVQIEVATFYVTLRKPAVHHTMGSLKIDTQTHVINEDGDIIKGFYVAGEVAGGLHAGNRLGGNSLPDIFTFGRIAGKISINKNC